MSTAQGNLCHRWLAWLIVHSREFMAMKGINGLVSATRLGMLVIASTSVVRSQTDSARISMQSIVLADTTLIAQVIAEDSATVTVRTLAREIFPLPRVRILSMSPSGSVEAQL